MSRTAAFGQGVSGVSPSLQADSDRQNSAVMRGYRPLGVLNQIMISGNGMSARDADRRLLGGGSLPTNNGWSAQSAEAARPIVSKYANI